VFYLKSLMLYPAWGVEYLVRLRADSKQPVLCDISCQYKPAGSVFVRTEVRDVLFLNLLLLHLNSIFARSVADKNSRLLSHFP
jgi:hypothetical protein